MMDNMYKLKMAEYNISPFPEDPTVTMAYVPYQNFGKTYEPAQGLENGTMFLDLNKPFQGKCGGDKNG